MDAPAPREGETAFTRRCLAPILEELLSDLNFPGLVTLGPGGVSVISGHILGVNMYPDLGVAFYSAPIVAIEVKLLRGANRQNSIATAVGQAFLYRQRYEYTTVFLVDTTSRLTTSEILESEEMLRRLGLPLVVRTSLKEGSLAPHPLRP